MRISDWSSDVCSSDLRIRARRCPRRRRRPSAAPPVRAPCARGLVGLEARGGSVATGPSPTIQAMARLAAGSSGSADGSDDVATTTDRSEEHTSELQSLMRISYAVFCLKQKTKKQKKIKTR